MSLLFYADENEITSKPEKKLKTFVLANGTTLATQALYYHTQPATESLTFNHTDASGTGVQQTTSNGVLIGNTTYSRTGEYSPMGRNIASAGPYITLNTYQEPGEGGIDLFGSGEGYRPGQNTYKIDGLSVSASQFMLEINSGRIGGMFGLLEIATRMSNREVGRWYRETSWSEISTTIENGVETTHLSFYNDSQYLSTVYDTSWSVLLTIRPQDWTLRRISNTEAKILKNTVKDTLDRTDDCRKYIADLINQVAKNTGEEIVSTDIEELFDIVLGSRGPGGGNFSTYGGIWISGRNNGGASTAQNNWRWVSAGGHSFASIKLEAASLKVVTDRFFHWELENSPEEDLLLRGHNISRFISNQGYGGIITIHELMHVAVKGAGTDLDFANAAADIAGEKRPVFEELLDSKGNVIATNYQASAYWHSRLATACGLPADSRYPVTRLYK